MQTAIATNQLPPEVRLREWQAFLRKVCGKLEFEPRDVDHFSGEIGFFGLAEFPCKSIGGSEGRMLMSRCAAQQAGPAMYYFILQLEGACTFRQGTNEVALAPDEATLIDGSRSWEFDYSNGWRQLAVHIPARILHARSRYRPLRVVERIPPEGYARVLSSLLVAGAQQSASIDPRSAQVFSDQIVSGIAHLVAMDDEIQPEHATQFQGDRLLSVQALISQHLADPNLTVDGAATLAGLSSRQLQRLFQASGVTFGDWLRQQRLEQCYFELARTNDLDISITDVAFRWGFSDMSHFSRVFRSRFGVCARDVRRIKAAIATGEAPPATGSTLKTR